MIAGFICIYTHIGKLYIFKKYKFILGKKLFLENMYLVVASL